MTDDMLRPEDVKETDFKFARATNGSVILRILLHDDNVMIGDVIKKTWMYLSYIIKENGNATVLVNENLKELMIVGDPDKKRMIKNHGNTKVHEMYLSDFIDTEDNPFYMQATEQMVHFIMTYYLRLETKRFLFVLDSENKILRVGIPDWETHDVVTKMLESIKKYDTNRAGRFWKREWIIPEQMDKTQGSGKE